MSNEHDPVTWKILLSIASGLIVDQILPWSMHLGATFLTMAVSYLAFCRFKNWVQKREWFAKYFKSNE